MAMISRNHTSHCCCQQSTGSRVKRRERQRGIHSQSYDLNDLNKNHQNHQSGTDFAGIPRTTSTPSSNSHRYRSILTWLLLLSTITKSTFADSSLQASQVPPNNDNHNNNDIFASLFAPRQAQSQAPGAATASNGNTCDFVQDPCRADWQVDRCCDNEDERAPECATGDCWDCDPCQFYSYSCSGCMRQENCWWCPGDAICMSQPLGDDFWTLHPTRISSCSTTDDWLSNTCDAPGDAQNVFDDVHYNAMKWMYKLINVESVWRDDGLRGEGIHVRINDDGVDSFHPEFIDRFDYDGSCSDLYTPRNQATDVHGTAMASIAGANNNGACSVGIAPDASISSCNVYQPQDAPFVFQEQLSYIDISVNSWITNIVDAPVFEGCYIYQDPNLFLYRRQRQRQRQRQRNLQQQQQPTTANIDETCIFSATHPDSPCEICTEQGQDSRECQAQIASYCTRFHPTDMAACHEYLDIWVKCEYHPLDADTETMMVRNVVEGRSKRGVVFVIPSGNGAMHGTDANMNGLAASRFTITVGAVDKEGLYAPYSTPGAPVLVSAPGGDKRFISNNIVAAPGGGCLDGGYGTDFAAPVVAGVAALMLEVKSDLGWRDVRAILAQTARVVEDDNDSDRVTNGGGYTHSYRYGFGIVDAAAAVNASRTWTPFPREEQILLEGIFIDEASSVGMLLSDDPNNATVTTVEAEFINPFFRIESVLVYLDLRHASRGDLKVTLTSPKGTESVLAPSRRPENTLMKGGDNNMWKFLTVRNFWEYPGGTWTLRIVDERAGNLEECIDHEWSFTNTKNETTGETATLTCDYFYWVTDCKNSTQIDPQITDVKYNNKTVFESCCSCGGGTPANDIVSELKSWKLEINGHISPSQGGSTSLIDVPESTCAFDNDICPFLLQFNHVCDDTLLNEECTGGDCFDCDACQTFSYDCTSCVQAGCKYCPGDGICFSKALNESFWALYPEKTSSCPTATDWVDKCKSGNETIFQDPLYDTMAWAYKMIDVELAWERGFTGKGVHVRINDDGVDANHPEFAGKGKFDLLSSCEYYLPYDNEVDFHGTACASIVAGNNNDECAVGIAPGATISSCVGPQKLDDASELLVSKLQNVDISSNSWGPIVCGEKDNSSGRRLQECRFSGDHPDSPCVPCEAYLSSGELSDECEEAIGNYCFYQYEDDPVACAEALDIFASCEYHTLPLEAHEAFAKAILEGRNGKGVIFVFSAGNNYNVGADVNFNGFVNSRFTIAVGAVGKDGKHASYSTTGAAVFISAPGGDFESVSGNIVAKPGGGCHDITVGTSFAAPVVSGVIALMFEVNANLRWRDVQGILALTAQDFDPDDSSWVTNAAGYNHSYKYGFGVVHSTDAMTRASTWKNWDVEKELSNRTGMVNLTIPDDASQNVTSTLVISEWVGDGDFITESVVVYLDINHPSRGDLKIVLTSPSGTESILVPSHRPEHTQLSGEDRGKWKLLSLRTWGEYPQGTWTLRVADESPGIYGDCFDFPWEFSYPRPDGWGNDTLSCEDFTDVSDCNDETQVNPQLLLQVYENRTMVQSCCQCGGGQQLADVPSVLRSWTLYVYGHIIHTKEELLISPPGQGGSGSESGSESGSGSWGSGSSGGNGNGGNTSSGGDIPDVDPWENPGQSGTFSGGGGTAYWSGWRRDDNNGNDDGNGDSGTDGSARRSQAWRHTPNIAWLLVVGVGLLLVHLFLSVLPPI